MQKMFPHAEFVTKCGSNVDYPVPQGFPWCFEICSHDWATFAAGAFLFSGFVQTSRKTKVKHMKNVEKNKSDTNHDYGQSEAGFGFSAKNDVHGTEN